MNSFNHYAYGAIGDWMYRKMAGLDTYEDGPGYKHIQIQPHIGGGFTNVSASLQTYYGKLSSSWKLTADKLEMDIEIPENTIATIFIPAEKMEDITESGNAINKDSTIKIIGKDDEYIKLEIGSGVYHFTVPKKVETKKEK